MGKAIIYLSNYETDTKDLATFGGKPSLFYVKRKNRKIKIGRATLIQIFSTNKSCSELTSQKFIRAFGIAQHTETFYKAAGEIVGKILRQTDIEDFYIKNGERINLDTLEVEETDMLQQEFRASFVDGINLKFRS